MVEGREVVEGREGGGVRGRWREEGGTEELGGELRASECAACLTSRSAQDVSAELAALRANARTAAAAGTCYITDREYVFARTGGASSPISFYQVCGEMRVPVWHVEGEG